MVALIDASGVVVLIAFALMALAGLRHIYVRRLVARIFAEPSDESALEDVRAAIEEVNTECRTHHFSASRLGTVVFRDHPISLVDGWAIPLTCKEATNERCVFAIARGDESHWLRCFSDVFELAFSGSVWSVFWVRLPTLMRLARRYGSESFQSR